MDQVIFLKPSTRAKIAKPVTRFFWSGWKTDYEEAAREKVGRYFCQRREQAATLSVVCYAARSLHAVAL